MKTTRRWLIFVLIVLAVITAANWGGGGWRHTQEDSVREAVFRWQIARHRKNGEFCFLTIQHRSASATAAFVASRFKNAPFVKPLSDSQSLGNHPSMLNNIPTGNGFVDAQTRKPALNFSVDDVGWISSAVAVVTGDGAAAAGSGNFGTFLVIWNGHRWNVVNYTMRGED